MTNRYEHILSCDGSNPEFPFGFACTQCGAKEPLPDRIPIIAYLAWAKGFTAVHKHCIDARAAKRSLRGS